MSITVIARFFYSILDVIVKEYRGTPAGIFRDVANLQFTIALNCFLHERNFRLSFTNIRGYSEACELNILAKLK